MVSIITNIPPTETSGRLAERQSGIVLLAGMEQGLVSLASLADALPGVEREAVPLALARALASSAQWSEFAQAVLIVRFEAPAMVALAGDFSGTDRERIGMLCRQLTQSLPNLRYVSYLQAQADCRRLATRLQEQFGAAAREEFHYRAVPRGGHIVLGMLAYALDLPSRRLEPPASPDTPLVVVDDCAMSGARFKSVLARLPNPIIFATLYSPPQLRAAVEAQEPRVRTCISAHDLEDEAPRLEGDGYPAWRERQHKSGGENAYWFGQYAPLAFAWNEPDRGFWNGTTAQWERGWNLLPPELCLKNHVPESLEAARIQIQKDGPGPLNPPKTVLFADFQDKIVVGDAVTDKSYALRGVSADMWRALTDCGNPDAALANLQAQYAVDEATLMQDLRAFTDDLVAAGLLEWRGDPQLEAITS